jgi:hypothetical protein
MNHYRLFRDQRQAIEDASTMPLLQHFHPGRPFDIQESQVCDWLCSRASVRQMLFNWMKAHNAIQFDLESGRWRGAAWREDTSSSRVA